MEELERIRDRIFREFGIGISMEIIQRVIDLNTRNSVMVSEDGADIECLLRQIIDMNGEDLFWRHLSRLPISKFNAPLRQFLSQQEQSNG